MIEWIDQNRQWVFSGIGVALIGLLFRLFRSRQQSGISQKQRGGRRSVNVQAGRDANFQIEREADTSKKQELYNGFLRQVDSVYEKGIELITSKPAIQADAENYIALLYSSPEMRALKRINNEIQIAGSTPVREAAEEITGGAWIFQFGTSTEFDSVIREAYRTYERDLKPQFLKAAREELEALPL